MRFILEIVFDLITMFHCDRYQGNSWRRAIVDSIDENRVTVLFVDYRIKDSVDRRNIRLNIMPLEILEIPVQAIQRVLHNIRLPRVPERHLQRIQHEILNHVLYVRVKRMGAVMLQNSRTSIGALLVQKKLAEYIVHL